MSTDYLPFIPVLIFAIIILLWLFILSIWYFRGLRRYYLLTRGVSGVGLEGILEEHLKKLESLGERVGDLEQETKSLWEASLAYVQRVALVRFNPYDDTGGDQSFAVTLLDAKGNGVVISSLHGRTGTRIYGKPVKDGKESKYPFSDEEKRAIEKALGKG